MLVVVVAVTRTGSFPAPCGELVGLGGGFFLEDHMGRLGDGLRVVAGTFVSTDGLLGGILAKEGDIGTEVELDARSLVGASV